MIKIFLADDHKIFRESLKRLLLTDKIAEVIGDADNGKQLLELLDWQIPDVVLMDISMPIMDGVEATQKALEKFPDLKVLALSSFCDENNYYKMVAAGAKGFVLKNAGISELELAINEVAFGRSWFSSELLQNVITSFNKTSVREPELTSKEVEILKLICDGLTNDQIANKINLSTDTVKWYRKKLLINTGCSNTAALIIYAIKNSVIEI
jgi:DNA-binding NarL/FixJ family response regulator